MRFFGVDVHQDSYTVACLNDTLNIIDIFSVDLEKAIEKVKVYEPLLIGVDAPFYLNTGLMNDDNYRDSIGVFGSVHRNKKVSEYELSKRNIQVFSTPQDMSEITGWKNWMKSGFDLYSMIERLGYRKVNEDNYTIVEKGLVEVFPHASFVTLLEYIPFKKNTAEGLNDRIKILNKVGIKNISKFLPNGLKEKTDYLDAISAAYTVYSLSKGIVTFLGDKTEGQIALPAIQIRDRYSYISRNPKIEKSTPVELSFTNTEYSYKNVDSVVWLKRMIAINDSRDINSLLDLKGNPDIKIRMTITNESSESVEILFERMTNRFDGIKPCVQYKEKLKHFWGSHGDNKYYKIKIDL